MAETKLSASQIIITASDIGATGAYETMPESSADNLGKIVQYTGIDTTGEIEVVSGIVHSEYYAEGDNYTITIDFDKDTFNSYNEYTQTHPITSNPNVSLDIYYDTIGLQQQAYFTVSYNDDNMLEVPLNLTGDSQQDPIAIKTFMASIGFTVANEEDPFDFYGEEPIELVLPTTGGGEAYTQGYFYKCVSNGNGGNSTELDPVTIVDFEGREDGGVGPTSIMFSKAIYDSYDPEHPELTGGEQVELSFEGEEADETYIEYATAYFPNLGEDGYTTRVEITEEFGVESAFAQMGFFITISEEFGVPGWISCTMPAEYSSSSETAVLIQKYVTTGSVELQIDDIHTFGSDFGSNVTSQIKFTCTNPTTQTFSWKNLATGTTGTISLTECDCISCEQPNILTEYDRFIYQYIAGESSSGSTYSWERVNVQPATSDPHSLGWYATSSALTTAHATSTDGDWAIVGATDTVWVWDSDTTAWKDTGAAGIELPSQTGNSGKFLTTNGTSASWSNKPLVNNATGSYSLAVAGGTAGSYTDAVCIGQGKVTGDYGICIGGGYNAQAGYLGIGVGGRATGQRALALGFNEATANYSIQLGSGDTTRRNTDANTFKVGNKNGNFEMMSADGTIPTDRFTTTPSANGKYVPTVTINNGTATRSWEAPSSGGDTGNLVIVNSAAEMPEPSEELYNERKLYLYLASTNNGSYDWGHFYKVEIMDEYDEDDPETGEPEHIVDYGWVNVKTQDSIDKLNIMPELNTYYQPYEIGDIVMYTGTTTDMYTHGYFYQVVVESHPSEIVTYYNGEPNSDLAVDRDTFESATGTPEGNYYFYYQDGEAGLQWYLEDPGTGEFDSVTLNTYGITYTGTVNENDTIEVNLYTSWDECVWRQFNTQPASGGLPSTTGASEGQVLTLDSNLNPVWSSAAFTPTTAPTLTGGTGTGAWDSSTNTQTITVSGVTANNTVFVAPAPVSNADYAAAGVMCTAQAANSLTFTCTNIPSNNITLNVVIL